MQPPRVPLRVIAPGDPPRGAGTAGGRDLSLVVFLFALHLVPVLGALAGRPWGAGIVGYATAVALVAGREIASELCPRPHAARDGPRPRAT
jgi:hypothetical protein